MFVLMMNIYFLCLDVLWCRISKGWVEGSARSLLWGSLIWGLGIGMKLETTMLELDCWVKVVWKMDLWLASSQGYVTKDCIKIPVRSL